MGNPRSGQSVRAVCAIGFGRCTALSTDYVDNVSVKVDCEAAVSFSVRRSPYSESIHTSRPSCPRITVDRKHGTTWPADGHGFTVDPQHSHRSARHACSYETPMELQAPYPPRGPTDVSAPRLPLARKKVGPQVTVLFGIVCSATPSL